MIYFFEILFKIGVIAYLKSIYYNFKYLKPAQAIHLPIVVGRRSRIIGHGRIHLDSSTVIFAMIKIGVNCGTFVDADSITFIKVMGNLVFEGNADIWKETKIAILPKGYFSIGDGFQITGRSSFKIYRRMSIGHDCLFSSDIMVMDYDGHRILDMQGERLNDHKPIVIGNHVWIGANAMIMSGAMIPNNCIVGSGAFICKELGDDNSIYVGNGKLVRENIQWKH